MTHEERLAIFDTHTHLNVEQFDGRVQEELEFAKEMGVTLHNVVGFDRATIDKAMELADRHPEIYLTLGWHPTEAGTYDEEAESYLLKVLQHPKVIALGEIGLDYYWMTADKETQARVFKRQMELAKELDLPFVVHTRDALKDTYQIIKEVGVGPRGGIMHSFSGTLEEALAFMDLGMHISFSGVVTFKKARELQEAAQALPLEKILVETDAPYLAPVPKRGRENRTGYTRYVVEMLAQLRSQSVEEVAKATYENARSLFKIDTEN